MGGMEQERVACGGGGTVEAVMFRMGGSVAHRQLLQTEWLVGSCCRPSGSPSRCGWTHIVRPYSGGCDVQLRRDWVTESQSIASALWSTFHPRLLPNIKIWEGFQKLC
nr:uncharacterized protein LOC127338358 isoform X2 [Lolium perenne]